MKSKEEFRQFYRSELMPLLGRLEGERIQAAENVVLCRMYVIAAGLVVLGMEIYLLLLHGDGFTGSNMKILFYSVGGFVLLSVTIESWLTSQFRSDFKHLLINMIAKFIEPSAQYTPEACVPEAQYNESGLYKTGHEYYEGEDHVKCKIGQTLIEFSEVHSYYVVRSKNGSRRVTVFKGLFLVAGFNKPFKGKTYALPDLAEKTFGSWIGGMVQSASKSYGDVMPMDDPEFEKEFVVYGSDPVEARYILSTSLMKRMLDYKNKTGRDVRYGFVGHRVYMAIPHNGDYFEPRLFKTLLDEEEVAQFYDELLLFMGVVEDLNLNLDIWAKSTAG